MFTRFIADRLFEKEEEAVLPNLFGALAADHGGLGGAGACS